jgi:hypothetical protein
MSWPRPLRGQSSGWLAVGGWGVQAVQGRVFQLSGCLWLSEAFREYEAAEDGDKEYRVVLKQHEVALVFDLNNVTTAGLSA